MKLASFKAPNGTSTYGLVNGDQVIDLGAERPNAPSLQAFIDTDEFRSGKIAPKGPSYALSQVTLEPLIPNPGKIICVGLNYSEHIKETGRSDSEFPVRFLAGRSRPSACEAEKLRSLRL